MTRRLLILCALLHGASVPTRSDQDVLQGAWRAIDARARMSNEPAMIIDGIVDRGTVEFIGSTIVMRQLGNTDAATYSYTLDTLTRPRRIRLFDATMPDSGKWTGIYRINGDTLRLSLPVEHFSDRPVPPVSFNGPNTVAYTFTRSPR
jgi:uncharacterized protein (TIGR03067 family)